MWFLLVAAIALSLERITYIWIWRAPESFRAFCGQPPIGRPGDPVKVVEWLFYGFKVLQVAVFLAWCYAFGDGSLWPLDADAAVVTIGAALVVTGQTLNVGVFHRLGTVGVFYGNRFGYDVEWCEAFPFSLCDHPQYVGTVISIWGFFVITRFPHDDWFVLPALETIYYVLGARFESPS